MISGTMVRLNRVLTPEIKMQASNLKIFPTGPFKGLDAEAIKEEVENCWKILYKLAKTFHDVPGSKRVAEMVRAKVEKFRQYVPVLQCICNPGLQERHWQQVLIIELKI